MCQQVSLGATSLVKDQGQCGSCWAYLTTEDIESAIYMVQGTLPELAVQSLDVFGPRVPRSRPQKKAATPKKSLGRG